MSQEISRETIKKVFEAISPYTVILHDKVLLALLTHEIDMSQLRAEKDNPIGGALLALVEHHLKSNAKAVDPSWIADTIIEIEKRLSQKGNMTWHCELKSGKKIYLRQENKRIWVGHYPQLEAMAVGESAAEVAIDIYFKVGTSDFLELQDVVPDGLLRLDKKRQYPVSDLERKRWAVEKLGDLSKAVYLDFESSGLDDKAEIVQIGLFNPPSVSYSKFVKPQAPERLSIADSKSGKSPQDIHGISAAMVAESHIQDFAAHYDYLYQQLHGETVVTYGDFDMKLLKQVCKRHGFDVPVPARLVDLKAIYAKFHGEEGFAPGKYAWQTLAKAYEQMTKEPFIGAHNAFSDAAAMERIVSLMRAEVKD